MAIIKGQDKRKVIPNWRDFNSTIVNGELQCQNSKDFKIPNSSRLLQERIDEFIKDPNLGVAADLISSAYILDIYDNPEVEKAINYINENKKNSSPSLLDLSRKLKMIDIKPSESQDESSIISSSRMDYITYIRIQIANLKKSLRLFPINPINWVEISRLYSLLGQTSKSEEAMRIALSLDPNNRFIVRSAVRLFVHNDKPEEAYFYIRKSDALKFDPWILSTEIATSCLLERRPKYIKESSGLIESRNFSNFSLTELSSALGTMEFYNGSMKRAKDFFRKSMVAPNDNSLAQLKWISNEDKSFNITPNNLNIRNAQEAKALDAFEKGFWNQVVAHSNGWLNDLPYSTGPVLLGSFAAITFLNDNQKAIDLCNQGLIANPSDVSIVNNLVCAYAFNGQIENSVKLLDKLQSEVASMTDENKIVLQATTGCLVLK